MRTAKQISDDIKNGPHTIRKYKELEKEVKEFLSNNPTPEEKKIIFDVGESLGIIISAIDGGGFDGIGEDEKYWITRPERHTADGKLEDYLDDPEDIKYLDFLNKLIEE